MNTGKNLSPALRGLLILADEVALAHGIPMEAVLIQTLAHASALAGHLITSTPTGPAKIPARFSILVRTPDSGCPAWIDYEMAHLLKRQDEMVRAGDRLGPIAALRRRKRVMEAFGAEEGIDGIGGLDHQIALAKRRPTFRFIKRVSGRTTLDSTSKGSHLVALAADGYPALRKLIVRSRMDPDDGGEGGGISKGPTILGRVCTDDWGKLTKTSPPGPFSSLGWIVSCGASTFDPELDVAPRLLSPMVLKRLEVARLGAIRFVFQPSEAAKALLDRQYEEVRQIVDAVPASIREWIVPDPLLAWHLAALLVAICGHGTGEEFLRSEIQCVGLATAITSWVLTGHVHDFRQAFPADDDGPIAGQDLSVFRFLSGVPEPVRSFQRRLHRVERDSCLRSLHILVQAGLAVESDRGRFATVLRPRPSFTLSDFLSEFVPQQISPIRSAANFTDSTDGDQLSPAGHSNQGGMPVSKTNTNTQ